MKFTFLGTSAAEGYPNPFCTCENCVAARRLGGHGLRKRASLLVNDDLLIDMGPDIIAASQDLGISLATVSFCLQTHSHSDHLDPANLSIRQADWGVPDVPHLAFYAGSAGLERMAATFERDLAGFNPLDTDAASRLRASFHEVVLGRPFKIGRYEVVAVPANHDPGAGSVLYGIRSDGHALFYGTDTAPFLDETWRTLRELAWRFDCVVLDHTYGFVDGPRDHLTATDFIEHARRMREEGLMSDSSRVFATHISPETNPPHAQMADLALRHGYEVAYDGMTIEC